jgi:hypothetical protein
VPPELPEGSVQYHLSIVAEDGQALAGKQVSHRGKKEEVAAFTSDDLTDDTGQLYVRARVRLTAEDGQVRIEQETEPFIIRCGELPPDAAHSRSFPRVRTLSDGLVQLDDREQATAAYASPDVAFADGQVTLSVHRGRGFRLAHPKLFAEIGSRWKGDILRWRLKVRNSGRWQAPDLHPIPLQPSVETSVSL